MCLYIILLVRYDITVMKRYNSGNQAFSAIVIGGGFAGFGTTVMITAEVYRS
jgi:hypothetical protein